MSESDIQVYRRFSKLELYPFSDDFPRPEDVNGIDFEQLLPLIPALISNVPTTQLIEVVEVVEMLKGGHDNSDSGTQTLRIKNVGTGGGYDVIRVIKIYDPACHPYSRTTARVLPNVFNNGEPAALKDFAATHATYEKLKKRYEEGLQSGPKGLLPQLHHQVLAKVAKKNSTESRYVPALVIYDIEGMNMKNLVISAFTDDERDRIMKAVLKAYATVHTAGIILLSPKPEDFIIRDEFPENPQATFINLYNDGFWDRESDTRKYRAKWVELRSGSSDKLLSPAMPLCAAHLDAFMSKGWLANKL
jgi:serine/threonine protein kinase